MEQAIILLQIILIDLVLAADNAIIIGMLASKFPKEIKNKILFWGVSAAVVARIFFTLIVAYLLNIQGLKLVGGLILLFLEAPSLHYHRNRSLGVLLPKLQRTIPSVRSNSRAPSLLLIRR